MASIVNTLNRLTSGIGIAVSWLIFFLVITIGLDVLMRYMFNISNPFVFELEWHLFAVIFLLGSAYTLQKGKHVRVDVFYTRFSEKTKAIIDITGTVIFLVPFCFVAFYASLDPVMESFVIKESSPDPGGLPFRFVIKSMVPISFGLLLLQGISEILDKLKTLMK